MLIGLNWAFRLEMRYSPDCPHLPRKGNKRYERVTPKQYTRGLTLPRLHHRLPQQGKVRRQALADPP